MRAPAVNGGLALVNSHKPLHFRQLPKPSGAGILRPGKIGVE